MSVPPLIIWVGECQQTRFARIAERVQSLARIVFAEDDQAAIHRSQRARQTPALVVLATQRPGLITAAEVDLLRRTWPLAGMVAVFGDWCEGETRTGRPLAGVIRLYASHAAEWLEGQIRTYRAGRCPAWGAPRTAAAEETWLDAASVAPSTRRLRIAVYSESPRWSETLSRMLSAAGHTVIAADFEQLSSLPAVDGLVWDMATDVERLARIERWRKESPRTPVVVLQDFPRPDELENLKALGVDTLLGKPVRWHVLQTAIEHVVDRAAARQAA